MPFAWLMEAAAWELRTGEGIAEGWGVDVDSAILIHTTWGDGNTFVAHDVKTLTHILSQAARFINDAGFTVDMGDADKGSVWTATGPHWHKRRRNGGTIKLLGTTAARSLQRSGGSASSGSGTDVATVPRVVARAWGHSTTTDASATSGLELGANMYLCGVASTGATERTIKQHMAHWRRTTGTTLRVVAQGPRDVGPLSGLAGAHDAGGGRQLEDLQLGRAIGAPVGEVGGLRRVTRWPWRLLDWWPAQADEMASLFSRRLGDRSPPQDRSGTQRERRPAAPGGSRAPPQPALSLSTTMRMGGTWRRGCARGRPGAVARLAAVYQRPAWGLPGSRACPHGMARTRPARAGFAGPHPLRALWPLLRQGSGLREAARRPPGQPTEWRELVVLARASHLFA